MKKNIKKNRRLICHLCKIWQMEILETSELNLELSEEGIGKEGHGSKEIERNVWSGVERVPPAHSGYKYKVIQIQIKSHTNTNANTIQI